MKSTNAERQAKYRQKRANAQDGESEKRINTYVSIEAFNALEHLSESYELSKKQTLEKVLVSALDTWIR